MPYKKLTDVNIVIKSLERCTVGYCKGCAYCEDFRDKIHCKDDLMENAIDIIKNQMEAEARWKLIVKALENSIDQLNNDLKKK